MHYVLEGVSREIKASVGFKNVSEKICRALTSRYIEKYVHEKLFDFDSRNARFIYLFRRLEEDVKRVVLDMLDELKNSDFEPLDFELDLSSLAEAMEPEGTVHLSLRGSIDRVDGWEHDGKLFLRVIDYKTGKKSFGLSEIVCGRDMQMLIYLFALQKHGSARYGAEIGMCPRGT
jgi:ATP-dependent helicase/nuclease subunit B